MRYKLGRIHVSQPFMLNTTHRDVKDSFFHVSCCPLLFCPAAMSDAFSIKRIACDRCRRLKLRCRRADPNLSSSCFRCIRSQKECVTPSKKQPGRPRGSRKKGGEAPKEPGNFETGESKTLVTTTHTTLTTLDCQDKVDAGFDWRNTDFCQVYLDINPQSCTLSTYLSANGATLPTSRVENEPVLEVDLLNYPPCTNPKTRGLQESVFHGLQHQNLESSKGLQAIDAPEINGYPGASPHMYSST